MSLKDAFKKALKRFDYWCETAGLSMSDEVEATLKEKGWTVKYEMSFTGTPMIPAVPCMTVFDKDGKEVNAVDRPEAYAAFERDRREAAAKKWMGAAPKLN